MNRNTKIRLTAAALFCAVPFVASADVASGYDEALASTGWYTEVLAAAVSDILDNPADDHSLHMRDESLQRNTDRFLIRARKPE